jgi:predicted NUDIX family NTP pyrophosphohydrolase
LQGGHDLAEEGLAEKAAAKAEDCGERVERRHGGHRTVQPPAHLVHRLVQPFGARRRDQQLVGHGYHCGEPLNAAQRQRGEQTGLTEAGEERQVGDQRRIEEAVVAAVVQLVRTQLSKGPAG